MVLWIDKYRPNKLDTLTLHSDINKRLTQMCKVANFPHLIFFGPSGAGKKTRVNALLRELYGPGTSKKRVENKKFTVGKVKKKLKYLYYIVIIILN